MYLFIMFSFFTAVVKKLFLSDSFVLFIVCVCFITLLSQPSHSIHDMEELQGLSRTARVSNSVGRLCEVPSAGSHLLPQEVSD